MTRRSTAVGNDVEHVQLISDEREIALLEAKNGLRQFDEVIRLVRESNWQFELTPEIIKQLNWFATVDIWSSAGHFGRHPVEISNTSHQPPHFDHVPLLVDEMCKYANEHIGDPLHVSAYLMWRLNWIHPFGDGNGRTSRAVSYLALSVGFKVELPGCPTIPDLITREKTPYYEALDAADAAYASGKLDVWKMQSLINNLLERQLLSVSP